MDRFKFRVWNIEEKTYSNSYLTLDEKGRLYECYGDGCQIRDCLNDDYIIQQCTGLKDKNDKLIYEGDIVKHPAFKDIVIFKNGFFTTERNEGNQPLYIHGLKHIEVVGNIYENENLLKEENVPK